MTCGHQARNIGTDFLGGPRRWLDNGTVPEFEARHQTYLGGVPATARVGDTVVVTPGFVGTTTGGAPLRFAIMCSFFRSAVRRPRIL